MPSVPFSWLHFVWRKLVAIRAQRPNLAPLIIAGIGIIVGVYHVAPLIAPANAKPRLPSTLLADAEEYLDRNGLSASAAVRAEYMEAARAHPLEPAPFYYSAIALDEKRDAGRILALLDETIKRNPRHYFARKWRARLYHLNNDSSKAALELSRLFSLDPARGDIYIDALVDIAQTPRSHAALLELLAQRPPWADGFIRRANQVLPDGAFLAALGSKLKQANDEYVRSLADQGEFERAFLVWQTALTREELLTFSWPADPRFQAKNEAVGIGWRISPETATREADGLYVYFDGRGERRAVEQTMLLGAGYHYTLRILASGAIEPQSGTFRWQMICRETGETIATLIISVAADDARYYDTPFFVPPQGCAAQTLSLTASSGQYIHAARLKIAEVRITEGRAEPDAASIDAEKP